MTAYLKRYVPGVPNRRALYVKGQGAERVFAYWSGDVEIDLRHECTHALLHASLPMVPLWLDEGLAQFFEVSAARRAGGHPHLDAIRWNIGWGLVPKLKQSGKQTRHRQMGRNEYRDSWAWVHFMLLGPTGRSPGAQSLPGRHRTPYAARPFERTIGRPIAATGCPLY